MTSSVLQGEGLISVIVPFSGRFGRLQHALESLATQDYERWEAIVVVDGAPDPDAIVASFMLGDRVRIARTRRSAAGPSGARNLGLMCSNGEIITYLDDDNRFESGYLRAVAQAFMDPAVMVTAGRTQTMVVAANGAVQASTASDLGLLPNGQVSLVHNCLPLNAVAHRRSCVSPFFRFHPALTVLEDWEFLIRLNQIFAFTAIDVPALQFCVDVLGRDHQVYGRKTSAQWSEFATRIQEIYAAYPARSELERQARASYLSSLQSIVQRGVNGLGNPAAVVDFVNALAGSTAGLVATPQ